MPSLETGCQATHSARPFHYVTRTLFVFKSRYSIPGGTYASLLYCSWCFGWEEMVKAVASAYYSVPGQERHDVAIFANAFAAADAIDWIGLRYGMPKAISGHQSYWLWGARNYSG